jgi:hypothetical protein
MKAGISMKRLVIALVLVMLALFAAQLKGDSPELEIQVRCTWWPPETGSLPVHYELQVRIVEDPQGREYVYEVPHVGQAGEHLEQSRIIDAYYGLVYQARVRAVDAQGRAGPWSAWNEPQDWTAPVEF